MPTISASTTLGIILSPAYYASPVVIAADATISNSGADDAVSASSSAALFIVQNYGVISGAGGNLGTGIYLAAGSAITNAATGSIAGGGRGIEIGKVNGGGAGGTVVNRGTVATTGTEGTGVALYSGASVTNMASGSISGADVGVYIDGSAGTVVNAGSIAGLGFYGAGVDVGSGEVTNMASATITGWIGVVVFDPGGSVVNYGGIAAEAVSGVGIEALAGGIVTNAASGSITGGNGVRVGGNSHAAPGTVVNDGSIAATGTFTNTGYGIVNNGDGVGVSLAIGGTVINAADASIIGNVYGIRVGDGTGTVINHGSIGCTGTVTPPANLGDGVYLAYGGSVTNAAAAAIGAPVHAIDIASSAGTVINAGVLASSGAGVFMNTGGSVFNSASGTIESYRQGVALVGTSATVVNYGSIVGTSYYIKGEGNIGIGVDIDIDSHTGAAGNAGTVANAASAYITGYFGAVIYGGTLLNAGTIIGNGGTAVVFNGPYDNLLVLDPGYRFSGLVAGSARAGNTLELASAASAGSVSNLGTSFTNFGSIVFDPGAQWTIAGGTSGLGGTISGFARGDTIDLTGVTATGSSFSGSILTLDEAHGSATLDLPGGFTLASFQVTPGVAGGTAVTVVPCFAAGTRILTASGEVPVEALRGGDRVATLFGRRLAPIVWIGHRHVDCRGHPRAADIWPIRVAAGAIGDGVPHRDLWLSPEHAILLHAGAAPVLVPIRHLLNGTTIAQIRCAEIIYWHVELASHDAIIAEGLPAETYLDTGNRADFSNGGPSLTVHPTFADTVWRARACAPQLRRGPALGVLQYQIARRAAAHCAERCGIPSPPPGAERAG